MTIDEKIKILDKYNELIESIGDKANKQGYSLAYLEEVIESISSVYSEALGEVTED